MWMSPSPSPSRRAQKVLLAATRGGVNVIERTGGGEPLPTSASVPGQLMRGAPGATVTA